MAMTDNTGPSSWARRLALGGLIPFVGLAAAMWAVPAEMTLARQALLSALLAYGATICSFLGAIHWGLVMREGPAQPVSSLLWGVLPSLLAWVALLLGHAPGLLLLAALLWSCFVVDRVLYPRLRLQAWLPLRQRLSLLASLSCVAGAAALLR